MTSDIGVVEALYSLDNESTWRVRNGMDIAWDENNSRPQPTDSEITAEVTRLQAEYDSLAYARSRKQEYDKLNQWEMQFDDNRDGTTTWVDSINEIKVRFPK
jgi:hypothetical protein